MSDTPRTDAQRRVTDADGVYIPLSFARQLEAELTEANRCSSANGMRDADLKRIEELAKECQSWKDAHSVASMNRDAAVGAANEHGASLARIASFLKAEGTSDQIADAVRIRFDELRTERTTLMGQVARLRFQLTALKINPPKKLNS